MAKNSKNNPLADGLLLLLAIPVLIFSFLMENLWALILVIIFAIGIVVFLVLRHQAFLNHYYDKERWKSLINAPQQLDADLTNAIESAVANGTTVKIGSENNAFVEMRNAIPEVFLSKHQIPSGVVLSCLDFKHVMNNASTSNIVPLGEQFGIKPVCVPMILRSNDKKRRGLVLYVFGETVLAFVEGPERVVFIGAYKHDVLTISCTVERVHKSVIVNDHSQEIAAYYSHYNPIKDATIIGSHWEVTNQDGRRSFRGGLLPENNPLHFTLKYGKMTWNIGNYSVYSAFSRYAAVERISSLYNNYKAKVRVKPQPQPKAEPKNEATQPPKNDPKKNEDSIFYSTNTMEKPTEEKTASIFTEVHNISAQKTVETPAPSPEPEITETVALSPVTAEEARQKNRTVANNVMNALKSNDNFEFKVYQVRKDRDDWWIQDAGVHTSQVIKDVPYYIEFNIRTTPTTGSTKVEFFIWSNAGSDVMFNYEKIIRKYNMYPKLEGYSVVLDTEYGDKGIEETSVKITNQAEAILKDILLLNLIDTLK